MADEERRLQVGMVFLGKLTPGGHDWLLTVRSVNKRTATVIGWSGNISAEATVKDADAMLTSGDFRLLTPDDIKPVRKKRAAAST